MALQNFPLLQNDILGRRLDILGIVDVPWSNTHNNVSRTIFQVGNVFYPSPSNRAYVHAIGYQFSTSSMPPLGACNLQIGTNQGSDWTNGPLQLDSTVPSGAQSSGVLLAYSSVLAGGGCAPLLTRGQLFTVKNSGATFDATEPFVTLTAIGWCE